MHPNVWSLVLAGGDGKRLASVTRNGEGVVVPKQFCRLTGDRSLLEQTLDRAERVASRERTVTVVTRPHIKWWSDQLAGRPIDNIVVQEANRGTAFGTLLSIAHILRLDPEALVVMLPSDHHFALEGVFVDAVRRGVKAIMRDPAHLLVMGIIPEGPETGYGWILPRSGAGPGRPAAVARFVEKPPRAEALELMTQGALWSPFVLIALARTFHEVFAAVAPALSGDVEERMDSFRTHPYYRNAELEDHDLSRDILEGAADKLRVMAVPPCGWSDVGTPERLQACLRADPPKRRLKRRFDATLRGVRSIGG